MRKLTQPRPCGEGAQDLYDFSACRTFVSFIISSTSCEITLSSTRVFKLEAIEFQPKSNEHTPEAKLGARLRRYRPHFLCHLVLLPPPSLFLLRTGQDFVVLVAGATVLNTVAHTLCFSLTHFQFCLLPTKPPQASALASLSTSLPTHHGLAHAGTRLWSFRCRI